MGRKRSGLFVAVLIAVLLGGLYGCRSENKTQKKETASNSLSPPEYVGAERCAGCHVQAAEAWRNSHHAQAMMPANASTVLGDFRDARVAKNQVSSSFYKKDGQFYVRTDGPDGKLADYPLAYTFGVYPLQQYLVPFPNGRFQSLVLAWDSRRKEEQGQQWFHLYPNEKMPHTDPLHWTGKNQTWNYMCADCHSTNLRRNYDLANDTYATTWSEINVACESCHGPGSNHVAWALSSEKSGSTKDLVVQLKSKPLQLETCAPCHSRRRPIKSNPQPGEAFLDAYFPSLLDDGVYFADGQIQEEDYEYGSFVQSKMYHKGVTCSDCHNPHSLSLPSKDLNAVCRQCHPSTFAAREHHHHSLNSAGALCVNCHMPTRTYMVNDVRRDHSFRIPRPDLSAAYDTPNACNQCHSDKTARWAEDAIAKWFGPNRRHEPHFVEDLDAARRGSAGAEGLLISLITDSSQPAIARATALSLMPRYLGVESLPAVQASLADGDALVRAAAVRALEPLGPSERLQLAGRLLSDAVRAVRIEAARLLAGSPAELVPEPQKAALASAISERIESEMASAERPENHMNLALLYAQMGRVKDAETELRTALRLDSKFIPAMVNLADLYRIQRREEEAQLLLDKAISLDSTAAEPIHALGLLKSRLGQQQEALKLFARAAALQPSVTRYAYVYAVALHSYGEREKAIAVLTKSYETRHADRDVLTALITFNRDKGDMSSAVLYADRLVQLSPRDPHVIALRRSLSK